MAYKCSSCNKFGSPENDEPELGTVEVTRKDQNLLQVTGDVRIVLKSACCSDEMAEANLDFDEEVEFNSHSVEPLCPVDDGSHEDDEIYTISNEEAEGSDRYDGAPGTNMRYRRHFWCANITATITCELCDGVQEFSTTVEEQASSMEALN